MEPLQILLVDDDEDDREVISDAIQKINSNTVITYAKNGELALAILHDLAPESIPCLIVLDLNMPKMNGTQTLENLKTNSRFANIAVVIYSTSINPLEKEKCMALGAHSYVTKPLSYKESVETAHLFVNLCKNEVGMAGRETLTR